MDRGMIRSRCARLAPQRGWAVAALALLWVSPAVAEQPLSVERSSVYVPVRDGTRIAVDIYRPTGGDGAFDKVPVILSMTPYQRATRDEDGKVIPDATAEYFARHGYVVAIGDVRGKGASFGSRGAPSDQTETDDIHDVIEWLAVQPWSTGAVGMHGCSYLGSTVVAGLRSQAPHLRAAVVGSTQFDQLTSFTEGGQKRTRPLADEQVPLDVDLARAVPVDADADGAIALSTRADKEGNLTVSEVWQSVPFRDTVSPLTGDPYWIAASAYAYLDEINAGEVPIYMYGSWNDPFIDETMNAWRNFDHATNLVISRGSHCQSPDFDRNADLVRFFDHWLKGVANGFSDVPRVRYYLENGPAGHEWQSASQWPLSADYRRYDLGVEGDTGTMGAAPAEEGQLTVTPPDRIFPVTALSVVRGNIDPLSVTFSSPPLGESLLVAGTPIVHLTVSAPLDDYVVNAFVEQVSGHGSGEVLSRGELLASRRQLGEAPFDTGGLPWPTHREADSLPVGADRPVHLTFPLSPMARRFGPGDRLRLAVTLRVAADDPLEPITVYTGGANASWVEVPIVRDDSQD